MKFLVVIAFLFSGYYSNSIEKNCSIVVKVDGLKKVQGNIGVMLFNQAEGFPDNEDNAFASKVIQVKNSSPTIVFDDLPPGRYAVSLIHDVNGNRDLDKNFIGIPTEPFGFSGNKSIFSGLPKFDEVSFELNTGQKESRIKLIQIF